MQLDRRTTATKVRDQFACLFPLIISVFYRYSPAVIWRTALESAVRSRYACIRGRPHPRAHQHLRGGNCLPISTACTSCVIQHKAHHVPHQATQSQHRLTRFNQTNTTSPFRSRRRREEVWHVPIPCNQREDHRWCA